MSEYIDKKISHLILPDDPEFHQPIKMGNPYDGLTPKTAQTKWHTELDRRRDETGSAFKYANSAISITPEYWQKTAQSSGVNNMMTSPMWFSPLHTPQSWQTPSKRRETYSWARFFYECFTPENMVLMADGTEKRIDSVSPGDEIIAGDGSVQRIKNVFKRHASEPVLRFKISGLSREIICTKNHEIPRVSRKQWIEDYRTTPSLSQQRIRKNKFGVSKLNESWSAAETLSTDSYLYAPATNCGNGTKYSNEECYTLGAFVAEGSYHWYNYAPTGAHYVKGLRFSINKNEIETFGSKISSALLNQPSKIVFDPKEHGDGCEIRVSNTSLSKSYYNFCGSGAREKRISANFINEANSEQLRYFIAGIIDGDGCYNKSNGCQISTSSNYLVSQIAFICEKIGVTFSISRTIKRDRGKIHKGWILRISRFACEIFKPYSIKIDNLETHHTKYREYLHIDNRMYRKIRRITEEHYDGWVYDLEIENVHSYCVNRCVVHNSEPKVAAAIDLYSQFPMNGFELECKSRKVLKFFEHHIVKKLHLNEVFKQISQEYFLIGDVFVHTDISCDQCHGTSIDVETKQPCNHIDGTIKRITILNPDWIEAQRTYISDESVIVMIPDEDLVRIVKSRKPSQIYQRIPDAMKELVAQNRPIPLSSRTVSHLRHMPAPYGTYGTSLIRRLFTTLAYKTKLMTANWIVAERLILPVRVVMIGSDDRPATSADIADVQQQLAATANDPNLTIVTHHNFKYDWIGATGKILQVTQEMEHIDKEILDGVMLNQSLLNGEMSSYSSAAVGVETLISRLEAWRSKLAEWCEERVFKPVAEMQGFVDKELSEEIGEDAYLYPRIKWNDLQLKDNNQRHQILLQLHDKGVVSTQTLCEELDLDYDQEIKRRRYEQVAGGPAGGALGGVGGAAAGGGAPLGGGGGGAPGADMMSGMPGADGAMGGAGGIAPGAPGGDMGAAGAPAGPMASAGQKIMKKGKTKAAEEAEAQPVSTINLTRIEQKMASMLTEVAQNLNLPLNRIRVQYPVQNPNGGKPFMLDFAVPAFKICVESDGEAWHSSPEQVTDDKHRDQLLAKRGWTVLRFDDKTIDDSSHLVKQVISQYIQKAMTKSASVIKESDSESDNGHIILFARKQGRFECIDDDYDQYNVLGISDVVYSSGEEL